MLLFQPVPLLSHSVVIAKSGKLSAGQTEIPFELPLAPRSTSKTLYETYHGIYITVHYCLHCDLKRSLLAKDVNKSQEFIVEYKVGRFVRVREREREKEIHCKIPLLCGKL